MRFPITRGLICASIFASNCNYLFFNGSNWDGHSKLLGIWETFCELIFPKNVLSKMDLGYPEIHVCPLKKKASQKLTLLPSRSVSLI